MKGVSSIKKYFTEQSSIKCTVCNKSFWNFLLIIQKLLHKINADTNLIDYSLTIIP